MNCKVNFGPEPRSEAAKFAVFQWICVPGLGHRPALTFLDAANYPAVSQERVTKYYVGPTLRLHNLGNELVKGTSFSFSPRSSQSYRCIFDSSSSSLPKAGSLLRVREREREREKVAEKKRSNLLNSLPFPSPSLISLSLIFLGARAGWFSGLLSLIPPMFHAIKNLRNFPYFMLSNGEEGVKPPSKNQLFLLRRQVQGFLREEASTVKQKSTSSK